LHMFSHQIAFHFPRVPLSSDSTSTHSRQFTPHRQVIIASWYVVLLPFVCSAR
jgi:hypothetical protein